MRAVAEFAMRGRLYAIALVAVTASLPILQWLASALVALVMLRRGPTEGGIILLAGILPMAMVFYTMGDPTALLALAGTAVLAWILRVTESWEVTLVAAVFVAGLSSLVLQLAAGDVILRFAEFYIGMLEEGRAADVPTEVPTLETARHVTIAFMTMGQGFAMIAFLVLGRWMQAALYNPGGFGSEFRAIRLSPLVATILLVLIVGGLLSGVEVLERWVPLFTVPFLVATLALVHWLVREYGAGMQWLVLFYVVLLPFMSQLYGLLVAIALLDSWANLRGRLKKSNNL